MRVFSIAALQWITKIMNRIGDHATGIHRLDSESDNLMATLSCKPLNDMNVLTRKVLMNKKNSHLIPSEALKRFRLVLEFAEQQLQIGNLAQLDVRREAHTYLQRK